MLNNIESSIIEFLQTNASTNWITLFQIITLFGSYLGFIIVFIVLFFRERKLSYAFVITFVIASVFNKILKIIIARDRPFVDNYEILNLGGADGYSMPSGHSLCAGIYATYIFYLIMIYSRFKSTKIFGGIFCSLFVILIAYSRMVLGVHYLSDTIVGASLGIIFSIISIIIYKKLINKKVKKKIEKE